MATGTPLQDYLTRKQRNAVSGQESRDFCYRCWRADVVCICSLVPRIANRTAVTILQHHRERRHPIGTERILRLGLTRCQTWIAQRHSGLTVPQIPDAAECGLLYPHREAIVLADDTCPIEQRPELRIRELIVLDGTWSQAKALYRSNPWLARVPHYALAPRRGSDYRIRRQPRQECLSSVEAVVAALRLIEPETKGLEGLLEAFRSMVRIQESHGVPATRRDTDGDDESASK